MFLNHSPYYVYMVQCADETLYTGIARDLKKRIKQHNGLVWGGSKYVRSRRPVFLVYFEKYATKSEVLKREYVIKQMERREKLKLIDTATKEDLLATV